MNIWNILGIEPTKDVKIIKSAYAARAKENHPEEHPEGFQNLQTAYKAALAYAKEEKNVVFQQMQTDSESITHKKITTEETKEELLKEAKAATAKLDPPPVKVELPPPIQQDSYSYEGLETKISDGSDIKERFWREVEYLLWHPYARQLRVIWKAFLEQPQYSQLFMDRKFKEAFIERLAAENFYWFESSQSDERSCRYIAQFLNSFEAAALPEFEERIFDQIRSNSVYSIKSCFSSREHKIYDVIWKRDNEQKIDVENYLTVYFQYAEDHEEELRDIHKEAHKIRANKRRNRGVFWKVFLVVVVILRLLRVFL